MEIRDKSDRVRALATLAPHLPPQHQSQVLAEALSIARELPETGLFGGPRVQALATLAPNLPPDLLAEALAAAREIEDKRARAETLAALATRLAELGYFQEARDTAKELE